ncbi:MAG TPA: adenine phosphoribosyltransferase [Candidatus Omnitrophica bacterium]|nr:MAG: adenine phosphoribosyltransferase [Candidatus Omnitrophota bacterium]RKY34376.1 MAG: adenine phosphoribosyltransferase [Candidatus Omnitrophota bacterium]RKY44376.1 MAG: adenine phosphoribosyltransferase [Candidatus Omnitrophota bacterium]HEC70169.1 adenine phosphoribosyltransferase [Candidatus Omnitrophota bacterium]
MKLENFIRSIPDFPKKGILFRDITTLLNNPKAFKLAIEEMAHLFKDKKAEVIVAAESRGFIFGGALAYRLKSAFVPVRKPGKLPYKTYKVSYDLEYGKDSLEIHQDAFKKGARVLILDDLLATGGTAKAIVRLVKKLGGRIIGILFLIELTQLKGRNKLKGLPVYSLIKY